MIKILVASHSDKEKCDQAIMKALGSGRCLARRFLLREELLEEIKGGKVKLAAMKKTLER